MDWSQATLVEEPKLDWSQATAVEEPEIVTPPPTAEPQEQFQTPLTKYTKDLKSQGIEGEELQKLVTEFKVDTAEPQYLSSTIDNPLTATGSALLATGAGALKLTEDLTDLDLRADVAIGKVQNINKHLSGGTKLFGDVVGASVVSPTSIVGGALQIGAQTIGEGGSYTDAGINTVITLGSAGLIRGLINKLDSSAGPDTIELLNRFNQERLSPEDITAFKAQYANLPKSEQTLIMAESMDLAKNFIKNAADTDITRSRYGSRLEGRRRVAMEFTASETDLNKAKANFGAMRDKIAAEVPTEYSSESIKQSLTSLDKIYKTDPTSIGTMIRNISVDLEGPLNVSNVLDIRQNVNAMLRKPSISNSVTASTHLETVKKSLDSFVDSATTTKQNELITANIADYRRVVNEYELGKIIEANTKGDYGVNWDKVLKDVKKEGLSSERVDLAIPIIKDISERFGNDASKIAYATPKGAGDAGGVLSTFSKLVEVVKDIASPYTDVSRYKGLQIQKEIRKAINKKDSSYLSIVTDTIGNKKIPLDIRRKIANEGSYLKPTISKQGSEVVFSDYEDNLIARMDKVGDGWQLNTTGFEAGSGEGKNFYTGIFNYLEDTKSKYVMSNSVTPENEVRLPLNYLKYKLNTPDTKIFSDHMTKSMERKLEGIRDTLIDQGINIGGLKPQDIEVIGKQLGESDNIGVDSLTALNTYYK